MLETSRFVSDVKTMSCLEMPHASLCNGNDVKRVPRHSNTLTGVNWFILKNNNDGQLEEHINVNFASDLLTEILGKFHCQCSRALVNSK